MSLLNVFLNCLQQVLCPSNQNQNQQQQQGQQQQQQGGYYNNQQQAYPPQQQQQPWQQQQHQHQQQQGGAWNGQNQALHQGGQQQQNHQQQSHGYNQQNNHGGYVGGQITGPHHPQNQDMINASDSHYTALRNQARQAGDKSHQCFAQSQQAYQSGDGAKAHELSEEGKEWQRKKEALDDEASGWIYQQNNKESPDGTVDLHGLYVKEAIERCDSAIAEAQRSGREELRIIVGKGIHSQNHQAKIKPAVEELMQKYNLAAHLDPHNSGVLVVDLQGRAQNGRTRDAGALVDEVQSKTGGDCVIM